jgi:hypothetical protein
VDLDNIFQNMLDSLGPLISHSKTNSLQKQASTRQYHSKIEQKMTLALEPIDYNTLCCDVIKRDGYVRVKLCNFSIHWRNQLRLRRGLSQTYKKWDVIKHDGYVRVKLCNLSIHWRNQLRLRRGLSQTYKKVRR